MSTNYMPQYLDSQDIPHELIVAIGGHYDGDEDIATQATELEPRQIGQRFQTSHATLRELYGSLKKKIDEDRILTYAALSPYGIDLRQIGLGITNSHQTSLARLFTLSIALRAVIVCLEAIPKARWIHWVASEHSPEESSSIFSLGVCYWLNKLFLHGYRDVLTVDDLYPLDTPWLRKDSMISLPASCESIDTIMRLPSVYVRIFSRPLLVLYHFKAAPDTVPRMGCQEMIKGDPTAESIYYFHVTRPST
ncbi:hypothetical protein BGZ63DRAFT_409527 [Mariannaea sp. PMI_226]|nr:hypothetical protein BGZ63DRAFT_409527 [Mariannaea sp. PMI_226]